MENHYEYASDLTDAKVIELDCGYYVHNFRQDQIAEEIRLIRNLGMTMRLTENTLDKRVTHH